MSNSSNQQARKPQQALQRFFTQGQVGLYRLTGGAIGEKMAGRSMLILTTTGRKSGQKRDTPLLFIPNGEQYVIIASNGGAPKHPRGGSTCKIMHRQRSKLESVSFP